MSKLKNTKVILLNGPAGCGKDVALEHIGDTALAGRWTSWKVVRRECKDKLHKLTQELFCVNPVRYWEIYNDRSFKELPLPDFRVTISTPDRDLLEHSLGYNIQEDSVYRNPSLLVGGKVAKFTVNLSIREAMIYVSEVICKPRWGEDYFGVARANSLQEYELAVDASSAAFERNGEITCDEIPPLLERVDMEDILLLRIHRPGFTYEGDSRRYIPDGVIDNTVDVYNNGTLEEFFDKVGDEVNMFVRGVK